MDMVGVTGGHIPFFFYFWGPALVGLGLALFAMRTRALGVRPQLGADIDGYTARDVTEILEYYGPEARHAWRWRVLPADMAFAAFYGLVGLGLTLGLLERDVSPLAALACGGFWMLAALCDIAENFAHARLADTHPRAEEHVAWRAATCTRLKTLFFLFGVVGVFAAFFLARPTAQPLLDALLSAQ